jgi:hypothetical protein
VAAAAVLLVALAAGLWLLGGLVTSDYTTSIVLSIAWLVAVGVTAEIVARRRPPLAAALRAAFVVALAACAFGFYWTSIRDEVVNETVVAGIAQSRLPDPGASAAAPARAPRVNVTERSGGFEPLAHEGSGAASVVRLPSGRRVLTLTDLRTANGPDLRVYLVAGAVNDNGDGEATVDLGALKGNVGDQQYDIPEGTDLARFATVVVWCRAFTVGFTRAPLTAA